MSMRGRQKRVALAEDHAERGIYDSFPAPDVSAASASASAKEALGILSESVVGAERMREQHAHGGRKSAEQRQTHNAKRDAAYWLDYERMMAANYPERFIWGRLEKKYAGTKWKLTARQIKNVIAKKKVEIS